MKAYTTLAVYSWILALQIWHEGSSIPSLGSQLVDEDRVRSMGDFLWLISLLGVFF